jgi:hypothetical protein
LTSAMQGKRFNRAKCIVDTWLTLRSSDSDVALEVERQARLLRRHAPILVQFIEKEVMSGFGTDLWDTIMAEEYPEEFSR